MPIARERFTATSSQPTFYLISVLPLRGHWANPLSPILAWQSFRVPPRTPLQVLYLVHPAILLPNRSRARVATIAVTFIRSVSFYMRSLQVSHHSVASR